MRQLLRHPLALRLITCILFMPERRGAHVEGNRHRIRLRLMLQLFQHGHKAVNAVCIQPLLGAQQADAIKGAVQDAVSVQNKQFHDVSPVLSVNCFIISLSEGNFKCYNSIYPLLFPPAGATTPQKGETGGRGARPLWFSERLKAVCSPPFFPAGRPAPPFPPASILRSAVPYTGPPVRPTWGRPPGPFPLETG